MINISPAFSPAMIKGITIYPDNPLKFDFIIHPGDDQLAEDDFEQEAQKLINYFMAALTVPEDEMWVNLSPYEKDRIIAEGLSDTEMGRDMLAQDYILKQLTATMLSPEEEIGAEFWKRVYARAKDDNNIADVPVNTFNKVWIVPESADIYVNGNHAFVVGHHLKVMLEEDYLALEANSYDITSDPSANMQSEIMRDIIIPEIEKEVNEGKHFAPLRQMFNAMILANWYKQALKESFLGQAYVDKNKTQGIDLEDKDMKKKIYDRYVEAFEKGVYDYVKEEYDEVTQEIIPRKYFSGGIKASLTGRVHQPEERETVPTLSRELQGAEVVGMVLDNPVLSQVEDSDKGPDTSMLSTAERRQFVEAAKDVVRQIKEEGIEIVLMSGRSGEFVEMVFEEAWKSQNFSDEEKPRVINFGSELGMFYGRVPISRMEEGGYGMAPLRREIDAAVNKFSGMTLDDMAEKKVIYLDDFTDRGHKMLRVGTLFHFLGLQQFYVGAFTASPNSGILEDENIALNRYQVVAGIVDEALNQKIAVLAKDGVSRETIAADIVAGELSAIQEVIRTEEIVKPQEVGGIDFNPSQMNVNIQGDSLEFQIPQKFLDVPFDRIDGFFPVIINISPITNIPLLLGRTDIGNEDQLSALVW
ncbi:MAG: hypothetical protein KKD07_03180 [Candidatus Omnitrophica bacterium]|nr:hypothetical protein [Candidatus Omnitrophota bacterium]MBU4333425.1 hypothetical protein [Candidatus Omnitrophota bacterium]